jgi:hypothetical protein
MPYDPSLPLPNSPLESQVIRDQLQALFNLINNIVTVTAAQVDSTNTLPPGSPANVNVSVSGGTLNFSFDIPQGQEGLVGPAGPPFANAVVDGVSTLNPGDPATVGVSYDGSNVRFTFGIPRGNDGSQGQQGNNGSDGQQGPQGPPFAQAVVDGVTTLNPGDPATVQTNFDGSNVRFQFGIPRGSDGSDGAQGPQGPPFAQAVVDGVTTLNPGDPATVQTNFDGSNVRFQFGIPRGSDGSDGAQGPPGEVSLTDLNNGLLNTLNQCSNVSNGVSTITNGYTDPEAEELRQKVNELIAALRR